MAGMSVEEAARRARARAEEIKREEAAEAAAAAAAAKNRNAPQIKEPKKKKKDKEKGFFSKLFGGNKNRDEQIDKQVDGFVKATSKPKSGLREDQKK